MQNINNQLTGKYNELIKTLLSIYNLNVTKINKGMYGCAYNEKNNIEIPNPKTEKSLCICLHEIGHKVLNHNSKLKRFIEEFQAWNYALKIMRIIGIPIKKKVRKEYKEDIQYAVSKAIRRGLNTKTIPTEIKRVIK